jgi:hypothetical protein
MTTTGGIGAAINPKNWRGNISAAARDAFYGARYWMQGPSGVINSEKVLEVKMFPLLLPMLVGALFIYARGEDKRDKDVNSDKRWLTWGLEALAATFLINNTTGLYPMVTGGKALYEAGQEKTALGKIKALVSNAIMFSLGFLAVPIGTGFFVEPSIEGEERGIAKQLSEKGLIDGFKGHSDKAHQELGGVFEELNQALQKAVNLRQKNAPIEDIRAVKGVIAQLKEKAYKTLFPMMENGSLNKVFPSRSALAEKLGVLVDHISTSQQAYVQLGRQITPACAFLLATTVVGYPLARWVCKKIDARWPELKKTKVPRLPKPSSTLVGSSFEAFRPHSLSGSGHGGGGHH